MKISVIVPLYNIMEYAGECIECLVNQSYTDIEIILVDDGSTDETSVIVDEWAQKDSRIMVIHQDNRGLSAARNTGMRSATGDCIAFIDGDDSVKKDYFATLVDIMTGTNADMSGVGRYENVPGENLYRQFSTVDNVTVYDDYRDYVYDTYSDKEKRFFQSSIVVWGKLYRREIWEGIDFPEGRINEDSWVFPRVMARCNRIVISPAPLYFYRKREGSIMNSMNSKLIRSKTESWMHQIKWWRESEDPLADKLLAACEKYICHYIFKNSKKMDSEYKKIIEVNYRMMVRHLVLSKYSPFKTKIKYLTYASPRIVF